jgi:hypothetical protein
MHSGVAGRTIAATAQQAAVGNPAGEQFVKSRWLRKEFRQRAQARLAPL